MVDQRPMTTPAARSAYAWLRQHAPTPSDGHEAVALAVHAILLHHEFRPSSENPSEDGDSSASGALPEGWGGSGFGGQYRHVRSSMLFDIRGVRMGGRLVMHAAAGEDDSRMHTVDVRVADYFAPVADDHNDGDDNDEGNEEENERNRDGDSNNNKGESSDSRNDTTSGDGEGESNDKKNNGDDLNNARKQKDPWLCLQKLDDLATLVAVQIVHRLMPDRAKQGYEDSATSSGVGGESAPAPAITPGPSVTPVPMPGPRPMPMPIPAPDGEHDDPLRIGPPRQPNIPGVPAMPFGHDDLMPPGFPRPQGGMFGPGGNLMGPGHFQPQRGQLPPGVPPGARFDPYAPGPDPDMELPPGFEDDHGIGRGGPPRGRGGLGRGRGGFGDGGPPSGMYF